MTTITLHDQRAPTSGRRGLRPRKPGKALSIALALVAGIETGCLAHSPSASAPPSPPFAPKRAPIVAVAPVEGAYAPTPPEEIAAAERHCLERAHAPLNTPCPDPQETLRLLAQCEQLYPRSLFPEERELIRWKAQASLDHEKR